MSREKLLFLRIFLCAVCLAGLARAETQYYIATDGSDSNAGTMAEPFATLEKARNEIRSLKSGSGLPEGGVAVFLRSGAYFRTSTFDLTSLDSGEADKPVVYRSYPGEEVSIVGGQELVPGWFSPGRLALLPFRHHPLPQKDSQEKKQK